MSKEIRKNREGLIRHFIMLGNQRGCSLMDCAKSEALDLLSLPHGRFAGWHTPVKPEIKENFNMSDDQWHSMEGHYENSDKTGRSLGEKRTFADTADWLQTLPGWPKVL